MSERRKHFIPLSELGVTIAASMVPCPSGILLRKLQLLIKADIGNSPSRANLFINCEGPAPSGAEQENPQGMQHPGTQQKQGKGKPHNQDTESMGAGKLKML